MKKSLVTLALIIACLPAAFAQKYMTRTGKVNFDATTKSSPEKIAAVNNEVASMIDAATGEMVFQIFIKSFKFEKELMQEHFNENYMESDKFPKADFKSTAPGLKDVNYSKDGSYSTTVTGTLTIHGATNTVSVPGTVVVKGNTIKLVAKFVIKLADYKISVPALVADKLSKEATINLDCELTKK